jgi:hypothetical protein
MRERNREEEGNEAFQSHEPLCKVCNGLAMTLDGLLIWAGEEFLNKSSSKSVKSLQKCLISTLSRAT